MDCTEFSNEKSGTRCITECPRGFRFCCQDCWILNCEDDCGKEVYDRCKLRRPTPDLTQEAIQVATMWQKARNVEPERKNGIRQ